MYDPLTGRFTFACPTRGEARVTLSAFRRLERLPGAAHPAVYRVRFACVCGGEHDGLVEKLGGHVVGINFVIELAFLEGRQKLEHYDLFSLITY